MLNVLTTFWSQYDPFFLQYVKKWQINAMNSMVASIVPNHYCTKSLLYLINTLTDGFSPTGNDFTQETLSVAQIIIWNYRKSNKKVNGGQLCHAKTHETPMLIYIPLEI